MTRTEKLEQLVTKMEKLNDLWWASEEDQKEQNRLEQEIRADMAEIGMDFDTLKAEFESISELGRLLRAVL